MSSIAKILSEIAALSRRGGNGILNYEMLIVLTILKYIGIVLLVLIGVLLLIGCLVLFVPVRYKAEGLVPERYAEETTAAWRERMDVRVKVTWLLHALSVTMCLPDEHNLYVRILGLRVVPGREAISGSGQGKERFGRLKKVFGAIGRGIRRLFRTLLHGGHGKQVAPEVVPDVTQAKATEAATPDTMRADESIQPLRDSLDEDEEIYTEEELSVRDGGYGLGDSADMTTPDASERDKTLTAAKQSGGKRHTNAESIEKEQAKAQKQREKEAAKERKEREKAARKRQKEEKKRQKVLKRSQDDRTLGEKLQDVVDKIDYTISGIYDKIDLFDRIWNSTAFQEAFAFLKKRLIQLLRAVLPRRFRAYAHIGTGDPKSTADIISLYGILYPAHRGNITLDADFEEKVTDGSFSLKGRIYLFRILFLLASCYFDKNVRVSLKRIRRLIHFEPRNELAA